MNDRSTSTRTRTTVQASTPHKETVAAGAGRAERRVLRLAQPPGTRHDDRTSTEQADQGRGSTRDRPGADRPDHPRPGITRLAGDPHLLPREVSADAAGDHADRGAVRSDSPRPSRPQRRNRRLMDVGRVDVTGPQTTRMVRRLRALSPSWSISRREARWVAERQARLLLANAGVTAPPVPERIVNELAGVSVYPLDQMPVKGLLGASKPSGRGGDILIDSSLPLPERRVTLMHELKHIIDGGHTTKLRQSGSQTSGEALCTDFALSVLMPAPWLRADWQAGHRDLLALAERYQVPAESVAHRLHILGLVKQRPLRRRSYCQWRSQTRHNKTRRTPR